MDGITTQQDLDKFLATPLDKQKRPAMGMPPAPAAKKPLPEFKSVQDLDSFIKTPLDQYDTTPVKKFTQARESRESTAKAEAAETQKAPWYADRVLSDKGIGKAIGLASAIDEPLERGIKWAGEKVDAAIDWAADLMMKPERDQRDWLAANGYPTLAKMGAYTEAINPINIHREAIKKLVTPMVTDPKMIPFLLESEGAEALKTAGTTLFTVMQQYGAVQALQNRDWSGAAMQEAFALLGMKDLGMEVKAKIGEAALDKHLDTLAQAKYKKPWNQLTKPEQAGLAYDMANAPKPLVPSAQVAAKAAKGAGEATALPKAFDLANQQARGTAAAREAVPLQMMPTPPTFSKFEQYNVQLDDLVRQKNAAVRVGDDKEALRLSLEMDRVRAEQDQSVETKGTYNPVTGGVELPQYLQPEEREAKGYYTLEEARKRLDEERKIAAEAEESRSRAEGEQQRISREKAEQAEGESAYREARAGKRLVVEDRRTMKFDEEGAERNRQEKSRLSEELNRIANENMYYDAEDMFQSLDTTKMRGKELEDWQKEALSLQNKLKDLERLSNPEVLAPVVNIRGLAEDTKLASREGEMRDVAARLEEEAKKVIGDVDEFEKIQAEADEAKERAEKLRTERDEQEAKRAAEGSERAEYPLGAPIESTRGAGGAMILPDGRKIPFHYAVVPMEAVIGSHDPFNNFEPNPEAIAVSQGRDYKNNRESQAATIARGKNPEMSLLANTAPTAETGPPIIRSDGQALGGRNRVNIWKLLYRNGFGDAAYEYMTEHAREFGVTVEQIVNHKDPMLVRVLDEPYTSAEALAQLGRDLDRTQTMGFSDAETAVMAGRSLNADTLDWLSNQLDAMGEDASLRDLMRFRSGEIIDKMLASGMIESTKRSEFVTSTGEMTERAKNLFESAGLGKVIDDAELLSTTPKDVLRKLERSVAALARVKAAGGVWDFTPELKQSLRLWKRVDSIREALNKIGGTEDSLVDRYLHPGEYKMGTELMDFGGETAREQPHPTVEALAKLLEENGKEIKLAVGDYADDSEGKQMTLGPPPSPVESFNRHIASKVKVDVPEEAWGTLKAPEKPVDEAKTEGTPDVPPALEPSPAAQEPTLPKPLEGGVTVASLENVLTQNKNTAPVVKPLLEAMGTVVKNALGMDLGEFLKTAWANIKTEGTPGEAGMEQAAGSVGGWARSAGRKLSITPFGEQLDLFGGAEQQFMLRDERRGVPDANKERLVLKSELIRLRDEVPRLSELVDGEGNILQTQLFGPEEENLFGPGPEGGDEGPQGTLFQSEEDRKLAEVFARSKSVGANEADWFAKAKADLFPGKADLTMAEISAVARKAREMRIAAEGPNVLFQERQGPWVYKSEVVLKDEKLPASQSGGQWAAMLRNKGVKADELKWAGIDDFLEGKKKVSKQELLDFIRENQLQVTEVTNSNERFYRDPVTGNQIMDGVGGFVENRNATKYSQYTLPGDKKNYTELLLTLPEKTGGSRGPKGWGDTAGGTADSLNFRTGHFDEPNILAHVRFDERTDASGSRVLFIEEVQSDWHQKGKKFGYQQDTKKPTSDEVFAALRKMYEARRAQFGDGFATEDEMRRIMREPLENSDLLDPTDRWRALKDAGFPQWTIGRHGLEMVRDLVPDAPFKTDWHEMVMKRMLRWAAEHGYDRVGWVTGEQTADRYDLSKTIQTIGYEKLGDHYELTANTVDGKFIDLGSKREEELADAVGKEVAQKIVNGEGQPGATEGGKMLSGLQLKTGGEWAKNLYDHAIPNFMRRYGKKWNASVRDLELSSRTAARDVTVTSEGAAAYRVKWRNELSEKTHSQFFNDPEEANAYAKELREQGGAKVHGLDISPEMKKSVMEGQLLFQTKKGATEFLNDGKAVVYLFDKADASTFLHEFFHTMRRYLKPEDLAVLEKWQGVKDGIWTRTHEEEAARAWEHYHRQTEAKSLPEKVQMVFKKIQNTMRKIYESLKGSPLVKPSKEVAALFDRWYGKEMAAPPEAKKAVQDLDKPPTKFKFGNTQANIPGSSEAAQALNTVRARIADEDLAGKGKDVDGNHITVRYGIKGDDTGGIKRFLSDQQPFEATLGKTETFPPSESSDGASVIKAPIEAPELHRLNDELQKHGEFTDPTFKYSPHATVAYVKPEAAEKYVGMEDTAGKKFTITEIAISNRNGEKEIVKLGEPLPAATEKIKPAAEMESPPLSAEDRKDMEMKAQGGILPLDTGKVRVKVFPDFDKARSWAQGNQGKIKGLQIFQLKDGRAVADFTAKNEKVLFQSDPDVEKERMVAHANVQISNLLDRLKRVLPEAERMKVNAEIQRLRARRDSILNPPKAMTPPPGEILTLWTPEGERPIERPSGTVSTEKKASDTPRSATDVSHGDRQPDRPRRVSEPPIPPRLGESEPSAGRGTGPAGRGERKGATAGEPRTSLRDVKPLEIAPSRPRGEPAYAAADWTSRVDKFKLPEGTPAPTVRMSEANARMLMPGQREIAESILSGLQQHDGYILAVSTGGGKTYVGSSVLAEMVKPTDRVLILTPSQGLIHGRDGWIRVAGNFGLDVKPLPVGDVPSEPGIYAATWAGGLTREGIAQVPWDFVLMDEVQEARKWWDSQRGDMSKTMGENSKKILYTSATPFHTALEMGHMGKLGLWGREGFAQWAIKNNLGVYFDKDGKLAGGMAPARLEKLRQQLIQRGNFISTDRQMEGFSAHFGKVPMDAKTAQGLRDIDRALQLAENYFAASSRKGMVATTKAQRVTLAKRWLEFQRLPQAIELGKKLEKEGWKVIFFSENKKEFNELFDFLKPADAATGGKISATMPKFGSTIDVLREEFGDDIAFFTGKHSAAREQVKDDFNDDAKSHLYATYAAGGVGVSLHDKAGDKPRAVVYLGPPWSGISFDQALGRPWRYGTKSNVRAYFLFSDSQAEMDLVTNKVAPRMESLRAMVSGVDFKDPVVKNLREVPENQEGALDYDHGNAHNADFDAFTRKADMSGVSSYSELPIVSAKEAMHKGMKLPGSDGAQDPSVIRLWQDSAEDEILPSDLEAPELTMARQVNVELAVRFIETGAAPGNSAGRSLKPQERRVVADAVLARADAAASTDPASATQQVYTEWENAMKQIDGILALANGVGMEPPPEGVPNVPGSGGETPQPWKMSTWDAVNWYMFTNGRDVMRDVTKRAGVPWVGEKLARSVAQYHTEAGNISGPWETKYWDILKDNKITPEEHKVLALTLANREKPAKWIDAELARLRATAPMNERIESAVKQTQDLFKEVFNRMQKDNIYLTVHDAATGRPRQIYYNEFANGEGYFPRRYDYAQVHTVVDPKTGIEHKFTLADLTNKEPGESKREGIIRGMMERHGLSRASVEDWLASKKRDVPLVGHIERAREADLPFFRTDPDVVISYLEGAGELLSRKKYFEQDGSKVKGLIAQIPAQKAREIVGGIMDSLLQRNPLHDESKAILRWTSNWAVSKMVFSSLKALTHSIHAAPLTNTRAYLKGVFAGLTDLKDVQRMAQLAGSIQEQTKVEMLAEYGVKKSGFGSNFLSKTGWQGIYKWGRVVSDATARIFMTDYALGKLMKNPKDEVVRRQLRNNMQLDDSRIDAAIARRRWTEEDLAWGGKSMADKTMMTFDKTELPPGWRPRSDDPASDFGGTILRAATILKGYQFKAHALMKDAIWDEARQGNFKPLIPFLLLYPAAGQVIWSLTALATGNIKHFKQLMDDKSWTAGRTVWHMIEDVAHIMADSEATAFFDAAVHGKEILAGKIGTEYVMGPLPSDIGKTVMLPVDIAHAKTAKAKAAAVRRYVENINPLARTLFNSYDMAAPPSAQRGHEMTPLPVIHR